MKDKIKKLFPLSIKDGFIFVFTMCAASVLCELLRTITTSDVHVPLIFVLVVLVVSFSTDGYFFGTLAAVTSVFAVNWAFTFPYRKLDFSIYGYPLTFITMLAVGIATSTLATRLKEQQRLKTENEREKMRANLLRSVSHDLRTPLTSIGGNISAVLDSGDGMSDEDKRALLENAKDDVDWLYRMVENLLSITKISTDRASNLTMGCELIEEILSETANKFKKRNAEVDIHIKCPDEAVFVLCDAMLTEQVLMNLMDNAVKHGNDTSMIFLEACLKEGFAEISVEDNGGGIDRKILPHIFDDSLRALSSDKNKFMGIGLAVCKTIVEAQGGTIEACNTMTGAKFTFTLQTEESADADKG